jgi:hypothetical protein
MFFFMILSLPLHPYAHWASTRCKKCIYLLLFNDLDRKNADAFAAVGHCIELDNTVDCGKQGIVSTQANIDTGLDAGTALTNENVARQNLFTSITLHAQALSVAIATIAAGTATFFMCHGSLLHFYRINN